MTEQECLAKMIPPGKVRPCKPYRGGVIQIWITRACDKACFCCTQGSNLAGSPGMITLDQFDQACQSLAGYWGVVGIFGGNPAMHPHFEALCQILQKYFPKEQRGLWCNNPMGKAKVMRETFNPAVSNLNVHMDQKAFNEFRRDWPESMPVGLAKDSRHSPPYVSMVDLGIPEAERFDLISKCDINQHWSAMLCVVRGNLRAYFCEIAGCMAMLHQGDPLWPDVGKPAIEGWWEQGMDHFAEQVKLHCHHCGVPLRGYGTLSQDSEGIEYTSPTHLGIYTPKRPRRAIQVVLGREQLGVPLSRMTDYLRNR